MARKRASMREGPLAELFRATEAAQRGQTGAEPAPESPAPEQTSVESQPAMKKSEAYRRYTILVSGRLCEREPSEELPLPDPPPTFVLEEVAHARATGED